MSTARQITPAQIERMYDEGENRVTQERNDFLLPQVRDFVREKKWLNLRPEYQRRLVWDLEKKSRFIESLLMNIPVPPVFLYETDLNRYEVMDGQQRLNTILEFYDNNLALKGLDTWSVLNGRTIVGVLPGFNAVSTGAAYPRMFCWRRIFAIPNTQILFAARFSKGLTLAASS